jgi:DNA polymerase-1
VNFPIQGTAADILKRAMLNVHEVLDPDRAEGTGQRAEGSDRAEGRGQRAGQHARMILTVHDELLIESPEDVAEQVSVRIRDAMQQAATLKVPLTVDVGIGPNWREAKS